MGQPDVSAAPEGITVDAVDWLPSGAASGLVRVRGRTTGAVEGLPDLVIDHVGREHRFTSLPDPRGDLEPLAWRGAYVVGAALVAAAGAQMGLEWPGGARLALPAVAADVPPGLPAPVEEEPGGEVVDRAVLAERRARRAEAAEQAQARIAREALRAVEVLELRANELEARLEAGAPAADGETAAVLDRLAEAQAREQELTDQVAALERALAERPAPGPAPAPAPDRTAERLRDALAATIVTVGQLRLQLHEAQLARRTRDIAAGADSVRRTVVEHERAGLAQALADARGRVADAAGAAGRVPELEAERDELRGELEARDAELQAARERVAALEADVESARATAERAANELTERAEAAVRMAGEQAAAAAEHAAAAAREAGERAAGAAREAGERAAAVAREAEQRAAAAEGAVEALTARAEAAESALRAAEVAREIAEAAAVAAASERRAAEVAHAARTASLEAELAAARKAQFAAPSPPPVPPRLPVQAAQQAAAIPAAPPPGERERVLADLDAAAAALRARPTIVSAPSDPPRHLARGTGGRSYPPLRGALVRLAHDDPRAAGEIIAGLAPAQWRVIDEPVQYTLAIRELDEELPLTVSAGRVRRGSAERGARVAATAHDLAQALAGHPPRIGRFGRIRVSGPRSTRRALQALTRADLSLEAALRAGARVDPILALRVLAYAVPSAWTRGHSFTVAQTITSADGDRTIHLTAADGRGLTASLEAPAGPPDATVVLSETAFRNLLAGDAPSPGERPSTRGDHRAAEQLRGWAERVRRGDF